MSTKIDTSLNQRRIDLCDAINAAARQWDALAADYAAKFVRNPDDRP